MHEGGECFHRSRRTTAKKCCTRPQTFKSREEVFQPSRNSPNPAALLRLAQTGPRSQVSDLRSQVPGFLSRSGPRPPVTHSDWLLPLAPFYLQLFFSSQLPPVFVQILELDEVVVLLSQSFLDVSEVRSQLLNSEHGTLWRVSTVHCTDAGEIPQLHKALLLSIRLRLKPPRGCGVWGGGETCKNHSFLSARKENFCPLSVCSVSFRSQGVPFISDD